MIESISNSGGPSLLTSSLRGATLEKSHFIHSANILTQMLSLPNTELDVFEQIFLWMIKMGDYQNPFNLSLIEYIITRMSHNNDLKVFMKDDIEKYKNDQKNSLQVNVSFNI